MSNDGAIEVRKAFIAALESAGGVRALARAWRVHASTISQIMNRKRRVPPAIAAKLGYKVRWEYVRSR